MLHDHMMYRPLHMHLIWLRCLVDLVLSVSVVSLPFDALDDVPPLARAPHLSALSCCAWLSVSSLSFDALHDFAPFVSAPCFDELSLYGSCAVVSAPQLGALTVPSLFRTLNPEA